MLFEDSSRTRMDCQDDVLQYYKHFQYYSIPLVHTGHMMEEECDATFWYAFHPVSRDILCPRLRAVHPF